MKSKYKFYKIFLIVLISYVLFLGLIQSKFNPRYRNLPEQDFLIPIPKSSNYEQFSIGNFTGYEFSYYNLSVMLNETTSSVLGNLTVDFYNDDPVNFTQLPFHIYASGMQYETRPGYIDILNVTTLEEPKIDLDFEVFSDDQVMWINLTEELEPTERVNFTISFNTTLPDGGIDRANAHGWDHNDTRIYKFASCYPMPCVYDEYDGWNTDPYLLDTGDPFYYDMAYYDLIVNVPENMTIAATGELIEQLTVGGRTINHYNPHLPVREVTFSASHYFEVESFFIPTVNITISTYFLPKSYWLWHDYALSVALNAGDLFYNTFGIYPYSTFNIVEEYTHYGGMEYPLQVYVTESADYHSDPYWYLETVIVHETAHQWFYQLVGNDEVDWGFLDEGIVVWVTEFYKDFYHPGWNIFDPFWYLSRVRHYNLSIGLPNKINQSAYDCLDSGTNYWYIAYSKAPMVLEKLRLTIGNSTFFSGLTHFFQEHYFGVALLSDLQQSLEFFVGESLDWFFIPWFDNEYLPKYSFKSVVYDASKKKINITIEDTNEAVNSYYYSQEVPLRIDSASGTEYNARIWINGTTNLIIPIEKKPTMVRLSYANNDVLVQFSENDLDHLTTTNIQVINEFKIPGFNLTIIVSMFIILGLSLLIRKYKKCRINL